MEQPKTPTANIQEKEQQEHPSKEDSDNGKDHKKSTTPTNGSSPTTATQPTTPSTSLQSPRSYTTTMILIRVIVALCSLGLGLLSPLMVDIYQEQQEIYSVILVEETKTAAATAKTATTMGSNHGVDVQGRDLLQDEKTDQVVVQDDGEESSDATTHTNNNESEEESCKADEAKEESEIVESDEPKNEEISIETSFSSSSDGFRSTQYTCDEETLSHFLHREAVPGLHVVCFQQQEDGLGGRLMLYPNALLTRPPREISGTGPLTWFWIKEQLVRHLGLTPTDDLHQPWAIFSPTGEERLRDEEDSDDASIEGLAEYGLFLVFQGGQWIWPGVAKGFQRSITLHIPDSIGDGNNVTTTATLKTLSLHPLVLSVEGFLSEEECNLIQTLAEPDMQYSGVTLMDHDKGRPASDFRTSQSTFLYPPRKNSPTKSQLEAIDHRTASLVRMPRNHQEYAQVLRYGHLEKYDIHHDYFEPSNYRQDPNTLRTIQNGRINRMATVFWYLTTVEKGGETVFPRADKGPYPSNVNIACEMGLRVKPIRGRVIIFYSMTPDGALDPFSLHGACPVEEGVKWAANKWVWNGNKPFYG